MRQPSRVALRQWALLLSFLLGAVGLVAPAAIAADRQSWAPTPLAFTQNWDNDPFGYLRDHGCFGVDDQAYWNGSGTLAPGASYTFTPQYPTCYASESPIIAMNVTWSGSTQVRLETTNPFAATHVDDNMLGPWHANEHLVAPTSAAGSNQKQANLCMFVSGNMTQYAQGYVTFPTAVNWSNAQPVNWSMTITNTGSQTATITAAGFERNGWISHMYPGCTRGDADGDHWNDMLEMGLYSLTDAAGGISSSRDAFQGSSFVDGKAKTSTPNDEADSSPVDFNDDGVVDQADIDKVSSYLGQGSGFSLDQISPNPGDANGLYTQAQEWRRYDIDGDGMVGQHDVDWVKSLVGTPMPLTADVLDPWAVIKTPSGVPARSGVNLTAYAADNDMISHVDFYVNSKKLCETWGDGAGRYGGQLFQATASSSYYYCSWRGTPSQGRTATIMVKVFDNAGRSYSTSKVVTGQ
jgi:hypothetical protein